VFCGCCVCCSLAAVAAAANSSKQQQGSAARSAKGGCMRLVLYRKTVQVLKILLCVREKTDELGFDQRFALLQREP